VENKIKVKNFGLISWKETYHEMNKFTTNRNNFTEDQIWLAEHYSVFTVGQSGFKKKFCLKKNFDIPILTSNRGGKITYHGPGQQVIYFLIDLKRKKMKIRVFISLLEQLVIETLKVFGIKSYADKFCPGIYHNEKKLCSFGFRVKKGCIFHGISINVDMDLTPFIFINICGVDNLSITQVRDINFSVSFKIFQKVLIKKILYYFF